MLDGKAAVAGGYMLLTNSNSHVLGGRVPNLVESWELKRVGVCRGHGCVYTVVDLCMLMM